LAYPPKPFRPRTAEPGRLENAAGVALGVAAAAATSAAGFLGGMFDTAEFLLTGHDSWDPAHSAAVEHVEYNQGFTTVVWKKGGTSSLFLSPDDYMDFRMSGSPGGWLNDHGV
jgi:hypothetical protein